jgi:SAM-dependent methyltransferase
LANNYDFCAAWVVKNFPLRKVKVLDYGCGAGHIVSRLRLMGVDAFGCDIFYEGGDYSSLVDVGFISGGIIKKIEGGVIPFETGSFDVIINNQVLEHVSDLGLVLAEFDRVLKPGGSVLSLFPDRSVWREGHCGVPFLHWFKVGGRFRVYYAAFFRLLGFGYFTKGKSIIQWSRDFCDWLDRWTHYRSRGEIENFFAVKFSRPVRLEHVWLDFRLNESILIKLIPVPLKFLLVSKLAGLVFMVHKGGSTPEVL